MKKLDISSVTTSIGMPVKSGTLQFLQDAYAEALKALAANVVGGIDDISLVYRLFGCVNTGSGLVYNISAGAIYYAGEVYLVDAASFTASAGQVAVCSFSTVQYTTNADPVTFTDGSSKNVHNIRKVTIAAGASGSADFDFSRLVETVVGLSNVQPGALGSTYVVTFEQDKSVFFSSAPVSVTFSFSFANAKPGAVVRLRFSLAASQTVAVSAGSANLLLESGSLSSLGGHTVILYFLYTGKNEAGNDEVSYNVKSI